MIERSKQHHSSQKRLHKYRKASKKDKDKKSEESTPKKVVSKKGLCDVNRRDSRLIKGDSCIKAPFTNKSKDEIKL